MNIDSEGEAERERNVPAVAYRCTMTMCTVFRLCGQDENYSFAVGPRLHMRLLYVCVRVLPRKSIITIVHSKCFELTVIAYPHANSLFGYCFL